MRYWILSLLALLLCSFPLRGEAENATPLTALARLPIKEITVFKDGNTFVLQQGEMPTDSEGNVEMDYLPTPVLGTFWPYSADPRAKLMAVTAGRRRVITEHTSLVIKDMLKANTGQDADVTVILDANKTPTIYTGKIMGIPTRSSKEIEQTSPPNSGESLPIEGNILLMKTQLGVAAIPMDKIVDVTFKNGYQPKYSEEEFRNMLTMKLDWLGGAPAKTARVGLLYLQKGIQWIPAYKITLDGKGGATVCLEATIVNDMVDLKDVDCNLVIGAPKFEFADQIDPMALQQTLAQVSEQLYAKSAYQRNLSNAYATQIAGFGGGAAINEAPPINPGPEVTGGEKNEDLYVFQVKHITLKKGERMVVPISTFTIKYKDIYTMDIPVTPPAEVIPAFNREQNQQIADLANAPKFIHEIRLINTANEPLTTAPALLMLGDKILAQSLMTYTPIGGSVEIALNPAMDITVKKEEKEKERIPNAVTWQGNQYGRINLTGVIHITNHQTIPVEIEVKRYVLGTADSADHNGVVEMVNTFEDRNFISGGNYAPSWWGWYNWPDWWYHFNGVGRIKWSLHLDPGQTIDLNYAWHYFWR